ncbi:MAG: aminopeptidase [Eggerthellaceae bacterium]
MTNLAISPTNKSNEEFDAKLRAYARLIVEAGCALKPGQDLFVRAHIESAPLVRLVTQEAYAMGAHHVTVRFSDEAIERMHFDNCPMDVFENVPGWLAELNNSMARNGAAVLTIDSDNPTVSASTRKLIARAQASQRRAGVYDALDFGRCVWCIVGGASRMGRKVFPIPERSGRRTVGSIFTTVRLKAPMPMRLSRPGAHRDSFAERCAWLNSQRFDALHYTNAHGTDLTVGLTRKHLFNGGGDTTVDGVQFFPNMPTEEIFSTPDRMRAEGTVVSAMPLAHNGSLIDNFSLTFKDGRVVDLHAETGEDVLRSIVETDENSCRLGEVALVPFDSPIRNSGVLFYSTLFDENASCHLAVGQGFPDCYEGGLQMSAEELLEGGVNKSATHVDFMIGTEDLNIDGIKADGQRVPVFRNGNWAF